VFLLADGRKVGCGPQGAVVFNPPSNFLRKVVADFDVWRKDETLIHGWAVQGFVEGGIEIEIPTADLLVDDGAHLPGPGVDGKLAALVTDFI